MLPAVLAAAAQTGAPLPPDSHSLQQVEVVSSKLSRRALNRIVTHFVASHAEPTGTMNQVGRWREVICPKTSGLKPLYAEFVSRRIMAVAHSIGAPTARSVRGCAVNVEIVFTPEPQELLNHIARSYPLLLGSSRSAGDTRIRRAVQSWYLTGTRSMEGWNPPVTGLSSAPSGDMQIQAAISAPFLTGLQIDPPYGHGFAPGGISGSHLGAGLTSELLHVFVIVDSREVAGLSLRSVSDYLAMVALTRIGSLDACSELPSITDLLSSGCGTRAKPPALTAADTAYLKALYSSDLEVNLNIEQSDMRDRMVSAIAGR